MYAIARVDTDEIAHTRLQGDVEAIAIVPGAHIKHDRFGRTRVGDPVD